MSNFVHLADHHVHELTDKVELVNLMRQLFLTRSPEQDSSPPRFSFGNEYKLGIMPEQSSQNPNYLQTKIVSLTPGERHRGMLLRFDAKSAALVATIEARIFTAYRTAATSLVAALKFQPQAREIFLIGRGQQSETHREFFEIFFPKARVSSFGRNEPVPQRIADIICTLTNSPTPVLEAASVKENSLVIAVGSCAAQKRELSTDLVLSSRRLIDSIPQMQREAGDYLLAAEEILIRDFAEELGSALTKEIPSGTIIFKSLGLAEQDFAYADYLLEKAYGHVPSNSAA